MHIRKFLLGIAFTAPLVHAAHIGHVQRQTTDCEQFGNYPEYKGPCEVTNCGAGKLNCLKQKPAATKCVGYPAIGCPFMGCSCST